MNMENFSNIRILDVVSLKKMNTDNMDEVNSLNYFLNKTCRRYINNLV